MIHVLDTRQLGRPGIIAVTAVEAENSLVVFDTGAESTFSHIASELRKVGAAPNDIRHVFVSHIHFDHAGAAWRFAELGATVYVHPRGAKHLIDPTKLVDSATRIFGDKMETLWGKVAPVPEQNVRIVHEGEIVRVGPLEVRAIETPGHASHHHVYAWDDNLFGGDVAGVRLGSGPPIPPFVPPELQVESWLESIDKMRAVNATNLYLPHFGKVEADLPSHFDALEERVRRWADWFRDQMQRGGDEAQLIPKFTEYEMSDLRAGGAPEEQLADYEAADPSFMAVPAALRYWRKHQADKISA
jgi:glyoxylase-like metal-dependent hydrolase (beta-lactamase superfamily II)